MQRSAGKTPERYGADMADGAGADDTRFTASEEENPHAGKGTAVVLDIGGDVGAVVLMCPEALLGREIEIVPVGSRETGGRYEHAAEHDRAHTHDRAHDHAHGHTHHHHDDAPPHVGVVARPLGDRMVPSAVFGEVVEGRYELALRPFERTALVVDVRGGEVTEAVWPED